MINKLIPTLLLAGAVLLPMTAVGAEGKPESHDEVATQTAALMTEMMTSMSNIKDIESAKAFAESTEKVKTKMKDLVKAAEALPAPTNEQKESFQATMEAAQEQMMPLMMQMGMNMQNNPDAEKIQEIIAGAMEDEEMDEVGEKLQSIYEVE
ncbi:MAG: hypothetical protein R3242_05200 [Akkermansiaceae bacterium]|nr:hypothetical protein [Akkermansiaceae bacterium]